MKKEFAEGEYVWIRGITPENNSVGSINLLLTITLFLSLLLMLVGALVSFFIVRRAFRPIEKIRRVAEEIQQGSDLTRRIGLAPGNDEVRKLAYTFDKMLDRLERSFEAEKQFAADASHELRTPLSVILAQCEYALAENSDEGDLRQSVEVVQRQAERMASLIGALLHISRLDREMRELPVAIIDISEVAERVSDEIGMSKRDTVEFIKDIGPNLHVRGDASLLSRLILNLLDNAFRYTPDGGTVKLSLKSEDGHAALSVSDTGTGIPAEHMPKIWNRFYRADAARTADAEGHSGLGLAMVSEITALHGGRISCASKEGAGTTFTFRIPLEIS
jgi:signal transduction histidine kinase